MGKALGGSQVRQAMSEDFFFWFPNQFAALLFIFIFFLWAASEVFNRLGFHRSQPIPAFQHRDRWSYWIIFSVVWGSILLSLVLRSLNLGVFHNHFQYVGLGIEVFGIVLREWAVLALGSLFTVVVSLVPGQTLVQHGPYRWVRHPAYTGSILTFVGFALALGAWVAGLVIFFLCLVAFLYRIQVEERVLREVFGKEYLEYMQHTWRLFPGL
jgi:protein-S-isoprenylcysteine O-methyltransferase Ste14